MSKKILQPNQLQLATQELKGFVPTKDIPTSISSGEATEYVFIVVKSRDNADGTAKVHENKVLYAPIGKYEEMKREIPRFKGLFNGMFNKVVILHDPTKPMAVDKKAGPKKMSNQLKGQIKTMFKTDGIPVEEIAKVLELDLEKVKEYTSKL